MMIQRFFLIALIGCLPFFSTAQILSPDDFLPHNLGETFTPHHWLVDYFQHVAGQSEQVQLTEYGRTNEQRPLLMAIISSKENIENLEAIRLNHLRHAGVEEGETIKELDRAVVWLSYSVHGNEAAGSEASMGVLYELIKSGNQDVQSWLENTIVIMDPALNPDGYSRYTHWYRGVATTARDINPSVREHREPWPGGRVNHYMFDLNRDWAWQTQVESQQRIPAYNQWLPHIHADLHEQYHNNPYYFAPAAQPYHSYISEWQGDFQVTVGKNHARYFDQNGWLYFTGEVFDLLYPSYGDTYPVFQGSIGMTYEQGGHSAGGCAIGLHNEDTLTLHDRIEHHHTTSLSTIETASNNQEELVSEFDKYFDRAQNNPVGPYKTYIIRGDGAPNRLVALKNLMDRNGIVYGKAVNTTNVMAYNYQTGERGNIGVKANDLVISAYQPKSVLTQVLFDPTTEVVDSLTYDITAWSMPYAYGLEAYASTSRVNVTPGYELKTNNLSFGENQNPYAYLVQWTSTLEARYLAQLLKAGIQTRYASLSFQLNGETYAPGSLVITRADNRKNENFDKTVRALARELAVEVKAVSTGFTENGPDLGSGSMTLIKAPVVATVMGDGAYANEAGQVWHYFEQRLDYPLEIYYTEDLENWTGEDVDILILPEGYYGLDERAVKALTEWVSNGGKLIGIGAALRSLAGHDAFGLEYKQSEDANAEEKMIYADHERKSISHAIPGAIYGVEMDNTHPLAYGFGETYFSLKTGTMAFNPLSSGWNVGTIGEDPLISGFVGSQAKSKMENSLIFGIKRHGAGNMVYLVDNPLYRGFWENGTFLFSNALFMAGQ